MQGVAKNTTYFTTALVIQKILSFIYFYLLSSQIFPDTLGKYVFALSYTALFSIFIDLGMTPLLIREASKHPKESNSYIKSIIGLKIPLSIIVFVVLFVVIKLTGKPQVTEHLVYLSSIIMILDSFTISFWAIFRSRQNMMYESLATIFVQLIIFSFGIGALYLTQNIIFIMLALVIASVFNFLFSLILLKKKLHFSISPEWNKSVITKLLKLVPAFAIGGIFVKIYNSSDSVILGFLSSDEAVGFYSIPAKTITALSQVVPVAFAATLFPLFSKNYIESKSELKKNFLSSITYLMIISLPLAGGLAILSPHILQNIWPSYTPVSTTFIIMSLAIPFIFLSFSTGYLLNACDRQKNNTINRGLMAILTIILNFLLIPTYGYLGAGITFFVVNAIVFILDCIWVTKVIDIRIKDFIEILTKSLIACIIMMSAGYMLLSYLHYVFVIIVCIFIYFGMLFWLKAISLSDIKKQIQI